MAEVNLPSWSEISQASEGLQLTSTAATWENILARLARIESRLLEHERRAASTRPPLCPEPDPPDGPLLYAAAQPQFQITCHQPRYIANQPPRSTLSSQDQYGQVAPVTHQPNTIQQQPRYQASYSSDVLPRNPYTGYHSEQPDYHSEKPKYQPPHQPLRPPTCWDPPGLYTQQRYPPYEQSLPRRPTYSETPDLLTSHGYPTYDQPPPMTPPQGSPSSWCAPMRDPPAIVDVDVRYMKHPFGEEAWIMAYDIDDPFRRTETATVHAAAVLPHATIPPPPAAVSLSCSLREQIGEGDALLEYGKDDVFLKASSLSRHEASEGIQIGPCQQISGEAVKAIAICCPQRRQIGISGVQEVDVGAINALAEHCQNLGGFLKEDNPDYRELLSVQDSFRYTEGVVTEGVKVDDVSKEAPAVADEEKIVSRNQVGEKECERKKMLEEKQTALHRTAEYLGAAHAVRGSTNSYDGSALRALVCGPTRICLFFDPTRDGTCLHKIWSMNDSNCVLGVSNGAAFVTDRRHFAFDPGGYLAKLFYLSKLLLSKPLVDSWCSLPVVENNLDGEVAHKYSVYSIANCYRALTDPISREHYEFGYLDGRLGREWFQIGFTPREFLLFIDGSFVSSFSTLVAILGVVKRLMSFLSEIGHGTYGLGGVILFRNGQRNNCDVYVMHLKNAEDLLFFGSKEDNQVSGASHWVAQEEAEEELILQKIPLQKMMVVIMEKCVFTENHKFQKDGVGDGLQDPHVSYHYTFDSGGDNSPKFRVSTLFFALWFPP